MQESRMATQEDQWTNNMKLSLGFQGLKEWDLWNTYRTHGLSVVWSGLFFITMISFCKAHVSRAWYPFWIDCCWPTLMASHTGSLDPRMPLIVEFKGFPALILRVMESEKLQDQAWVHGLSISHVDTFTWKMTSPTGEEVWKSLSPNH